MRKYFGAAAGAVFIAALTLAFWQGGRDPFESPVSSIPSILIDHMRDDTTGLNETEIFVKGLADFRYANMTVRVSDGNQTFERVRLHAYFIFYNTSLELFTVNVTVWNRDREYTFNGTVEVAPPESAPLVLTLREEERDRTHTHALNSDNLPWRKFMERVQ
ncbi:MAG: hypothetical protein FJ149_08370 [Euryarchaeota archaeon]|nr:hypothetical protein [Euryarchaeota archaeon]